jgi:predicted short-subunit dehydrogenase-like oxidoreductase (DUF2520 family)
MGELERDPSEDPPACRRLAIVGRGRMGSALAAALQGAFEVEGPLGRDESPKSPDAVLLCVPDAEIARAAAGIEPGPLVGHCSGASTLDPLKPHKAFSFHPLMTVTASGARFEGAGAAIAGTTARARDLAKDIARALSMSPVEVPDEDRVAYHAAASIASNFLVTLEAAAEEVARTAGLERELLVPLVRATVENWASEGAERALTGPVARGDLETVARQRDAVQARAPELLPLFDALVQATLELAHEGALTR